MERGLGVTGPITAAQQAAVDDAVAAAGPGPRQRERLEMVKAAWLGQDVATIARWSGRTPRTVRRWLAAFRDGGVAALAGAPIPGRPPKADAAYLAALEQAVETPPRDAGAAVRCLDLRAPRAPTWRARPACRIAPGWLRVLLHRQRFACGRPKHTLGHLQDPEEVAACEAALRVAGEKGRGAAGAVRVAL